MIPEANLVAELQALLALLNEPQLTDAEGSLPNEAELHHAECYIYPL